jgi:hypothetical protein
MTATHAPAAMPAHSFVNAEFSDNRLDGNLILKLFIDRIVLRDVAATMRTADRQRRFEDFVNLIVGRNGATCTLAVSGTAGPGRRLGIPLGFALGEWRRLPLVGALGLFELRLETIASGASSRGASSRCVFQSVAMSRCVVVHLHHTHEVKRQVIRWRCTCCHRRTGRQPHHGRSRAMAGSRAACRRSSGLVATGGV